jgi:hypothetical protein
MTWVLPNEILDGNVTLRQLTSTGLYTHRAGQQAPEQLSATTNAAGMSGIPVLYLWCNTLLPE